MLQLFVTQTLLSSLRSLSDRSACSGWKPAFFDCIFVATSLHSVKGGARIRFGNLKHLTVNFYPGLPYVWPHHARNITLETNLLHFMINSLISCAILLEAPPSP